MSHRRQLRIAFVLHPIATVLAMCMLGSTLFLVAACSTQNNIVNPSPGTWKIVHSANPGSAQNYLIAVAATSATDAWAVGSFSNKHLGSQGTKALIEHWNGAVWSVSTSPTTPSGNSFLEGVVALSPTNAWAVGNTFSDSNNTVQQTLIEHWNGTAWAVIASPTFAHGADLTAITALSDNDIWAVGYINNSTQTLIQQSLIIHWDGKTWREVPNPNPGSKFNYLTGLAAIASNDVWTVGTFSNDTNGIAMGEEIIEHWNGTAWAVIPNPNAGKPANFLSAIAAVSTNDVWIVGNAINDNSVTNTLIQHWNGKVWSNVKGQNPGKELNVLGSVVALSTHDVWAVGSLSNSFDNSQTQPLIEHWNGSTWSTVTSPGIGTSNTTLEDMVSVPHSAKIWAVGTGATYGAPINVTPTTGGLTQETPVTAQTLIESCCS